MIDLTKIKALSFDCYGTLIDWETGLKSVLNAWAEDRGVAARDDQLLESFGRFEGAVQAAAPAMLYSNVLREVLRRMADDAGVAAGEAWQECLARSVGAWPPFPDSVEALIKLRRRYKLAILSNVDRISFQGSSAQLLSGFDLVVTAEDVGSYKPDTRNFEALISRLAEIGVGRGEFLHVAQSLHHDHAPAADLGLPTIWINRRHGKSGSGATPAVEGQSGHAKEFASMRDFATWACA